MLQQSVDRIYHFDPDLWIFAPEFISVLVLHLCMKYEVNRLKTNWVMALQESVDRQTGNLKVISIRLQHLW